jgi:hypothetical protein
MVRCAPLSSSPNTGGSRLCGRSIRSRRSQTYTLAISGAVSDRGIAIVPATITFTTVARKPGADIADSEAWRPGTGKDGWRSGRGPSPWETLAPLQAPPGVTAVSGRVLRLDGRPLPDVTLELEGHETEADRTGRFLLRIEGLATGEHTLEIDARTANTPRRTYGFYEARIILRAGGTNVLPFTIWSPLIDTAHQVTMASPTLSETVITTPLIPGLELHLPAGTVIRDEDGQVARTISITPVPLDAVPAPRGRDLQHVFHDSAWRRVSPHAGSHQRGLAGVSPDRAVAARQARPVLQLRPGRQGLVSGALYNAR